jgi:hypothetical protein
MSTEGVRRFWPLALGVVLGIVVGVLVSLLGSTQRKAEAKVLVSSPAGTTAVRPQLPNLRELASSGVVAGNVRSTLRLSESAEKLRKHLDADVRPGSDVIAVSFTGESGERARQIAQEAATVFAQLVGTRFATATPELHAAVLDSAHVVGEPDRHFLRNCAIGALVGLLLGAAVFFVLAGTERVAPVPRDDSELRWREQILEERIVGVTARERAMAAQAGRLTAREQALAAREQAVTERERAPTEPEPEAEPASGSEPQVPEPEPEPEAAAASGSEPQVPEPEAVAPPAVATHAGAWTIDELERAVEARSDASPTQREEWRTYLFFLRQHAAVNGSLPAQFDGLITDIFGELT